MTKNWTPEPWGYWPESCYPGGVVSNVDGQHIAIPIHFERAPELTKANAARIVACVNALAGVDDPQGFVERDYTR